MTWGIAGCSRSDPRLEQTVLHPAAGASHASPSHSAATKPTPEPAASGAGAEEPRITAQADASPVKGVSIAGAGTAEAVVQVPAASAQTKPVSPVEPTLTPMPVPTPTPKPKETAPIVRIPVLNYHSIGTDPGNNAVLDPKKLEEQMAYLAKEGYTTLTLRQFIEIWEGKRTAPVKSVLLTFDDGYADNHEKALPILQKHGFHATLFMSPGTVGDGWYVDWQQAKELHEAGWDIQPHGMTHPYLNKLSPEKQKEEILEAAKQIEEQLGIKAEVFCYPYGVYNKETIKILTDHQFKLAFTIDQGYADTSQNRFTLKRLFISGSETMNSFIQKLTKG